MFVMPKSGSNSEIGTALYCSSKRGITSLTDRPVGVKC